MFCDRFSVRWLLMASTPAVVAISRGGGGGGSIKCILDSPHHSTQRQRLLLGVEGANETVDGESNHHKLTRVLRGLRNAAERGTRRTRDDVINCRLEIKCCVKYMLMSCRLAAGGGRREEEEGNGIQRTGENGRSQETTREPWEAPTVSQ
uniref:Putative secreted protein n=1 Tax=Anopheles darlingi TaxID=43151 RepID=A0A2M4D7X9_ANODA